MDSMGSIVPHDTVVMLYKLHTQHRATGWQRQTTMLENTFQFCAQQQQRKRRWWWRGWDGEDVSVGGCQRQQLTGKQTEGQRDRQTHRLSVWKRKEGSQLKRSRVRQDGEGDPIVYAVVCVALATVRMSDFFAACLCLCCKFIASEMFCLKFLQNLFGLPAALPCIPSCPGALVLPGYTRFSYSLGNKLAKEIERKYAWKFLVAKTFRLSTYLSSVCASV